MRFDHKVNRILSILLVALLIAGLLVLAGCSSGKTKTSVRSTRQSSISAVASPSTVTAQVHASCTAGWGCDENTKYFLKSDCTRASVTLCARGCQDGDCIKSIEDQNTDDARSGSDSLDFEIINTETEEEGDLVKTDTHELREGEAAVMVVEDATVYVKVLVISEVDGRVKLKIDDDKSFGIANGGMIVLKDEDDDDDELVIEIVDVKIPINPGEQKSVVLRLGRIVN